MEPRRRIPATAAAITPCNPDLGSAEATASAVSSAIDETSAPSKAADGIANSGSAESTDGQADVSTKRDVKTAAPVAKNPSMSQNMLAKVERDS